MNLSRPTTTLVLALALAAIAAPAALAHAAPEDAKTSDPKAAEQATPPANPRRTRPVRKPIIDLKKQAAERRPGQVMPGDPTPAGATNIPPAAELQDRPIDLIDAAAAPRAELKPAPETAITPRSQPQAQQAQPQPEPAPIPQPAAQPTQPIAQPTEPLSAPPVPSEPALAPVVPVPATHPEPIAAPAAPPVAAQAAPSEPEPMPEVRVVQVQPSQGLDETTPAQPAAQPEPVAAPKPQPTRVAPQPSRGLVDQLSSPSSTGPIALTVKRAGPGVQWRLEGASWSSPATDQAITGKIEIRCGLESEIELTLSESATLRVQRLGRVVIEQSTEPDGRVIPSITLARGAIEIIPSDLGANAMFARIKTPDKLFGVAAPMRIEYDAFSGTKRSLVNP